MLILNDYKTMRIILSFWVLFLFFPTTIFAQNFINNGTFEYGGSGVGFVVDGQGYNLLTPPYSGNTSAGNYAFVTNPQTINTQFFVNSGDHTNGTGKMLAVDGNSTGGQQRLWKAGNNGGGICNLNVGQTYVFSYWIRSISNAVANNGELANIGVSFNNASNVSLVFGQSLAPLPNFGWQQVRYTFTPTNACVNIEIYNNNTGFVGNDFALDDIALTPPPSPLSFTYSVTNPNCSDPNSGFIAIYPTGGIAPYTFRVEGTDSVTNSTGIFTDLTAGTYLIGLEDATGDRDSIFNVILSSNSVLSITPGDTAICPNSNLTFTASGSTSGYSWSSSPTDPELTINNQSSITVSPSAAITYTVASNLTDVNLVFNGDFELGNSGFQSEYVYYNPNNPTGAQRAYGIVTNSSNWFPSFGNCVDFTIGDGTGKFMVLDGSTYNQGNDKFWCQKIAVEPNKDYTFSYRLQTISAGNDAIVLTKVNDVSIGSFYALPQVCSWTEVSYNWNSGTDTIAEFCLIDQQFSAGGNNFSIDDIKLVADQSCTQSVNVTMATVNPDLGQTYPENICLNEGIVLPILNPNFVSGGIYNIVGQGLNINNLTGAVNPVGSTPGNYNITYTAQVCGVNVTDTTTITIRPLPGLLELTGGDFYCENFQFNPLTLFVEGTPNYTIYYNLDGVPQVVSDQSTVPISIGNAFGVYDLDSITDLYCTNVMVGAQTISMTDGPQLPIIAGDSVYCKNSNVNEIYVTNAQGTINWYADSALTVSLGSSISFLPSNQETMTYYATENFNGCEGLATAVTVFIEDCQLIIPTAFTPNGDGTNDVWEIIGLDEQFPESKVTVFNRWGESIYESTQGNYTNKPWNGKYKEGVLPVSSYYFVIQRSSDGSVEPLSGTVSIILKK